MYYETPKYKPGNNSEVVSGSEKPETDHFLLFKKEDFNIEIYVKRVHIP